MDQENLGCGVIAGIALLSAVNIVFCVLAHFYPSPCAALSVWTGALLCVLSLLAHFFLNVDDFRIILRAAFAVNAICLCVVLPLYSSVT